MSISQPKIPAVVSLQHVVRNYINERGLDMSEYSRFLQIAIRGFSQINMTEMKSYDVHRAIANASGQIFLPPDYVDYTKIGYRLGDKIYILSLNKDLYINSDDNNGSVEISSDSGDIDYRYFFVDHNYNGSLISGLYGYPGGYSPQCFNIDFDNKVLQLSSQVPRVQILIEYVSTGIAMNGNTYIPRYAEPALIEWLYWRDAKGSYDGTKVTRGTLSDMKQDFNEELSVLRDIHTFPTYQEAMDAIYSSVKQSPKR